MKQSGLKIWATKVGRMNVNDYSDNVDSGSESDAKTMGCYALNISVGLKREGEQAFKLWRRAS
jgi:hypothetical protein